MTNKPMLSVERQCKECGSKSLSWDVHSKSDSGVAEGRLRSSEVQCLFVLGCNECSETILVVGSDKVAAELNELRALLDQPVDSNELSLGGSLARAASGLINVLDDETGAWTETEALKRALEDWSMGKPAAQHQGEPTPITGDMDRLMEAYRLGEFSDEGGSDTVEALSVASFDAAESHGHDADSYMAGYCAALYEQAKPFIWLALKPKQQGEPVAWVNGEQLRLCAKSPRHDEPENPMLHNLPRNIAGSALRGDYCDTPLYAEQPASVAMALPFAEKVIAKLQRFEACASDGQDVDIGRHWFDLLTQLELLRRVQRSPAYWEMTQQGEDALKATRLNSPQ